MTEPAQQPSGEMRLRKLRWLCRRGMKELDVLLAAFIARHAASLRFGGWPEFEALLQLEDDQLWDCLLDSNHQAASGFHLILADISRGPAQPD